MAGMEPYVFSNEVGAMPVCILDEIIISRRKNDRKVSQNGYK
jgi:hypothetical protein